MNIPARFFLLLMVLSTPLQAQVAVIAIGSNVSLEKDLKPLRFAVTDARRFAHTMQNWGRVASESISLQENPSKKQVVDAIRWARNKWHNTGDLESQKFIFYYSGHADARGLHLADGIFSKHELHQALESISAKTKVIILDSCFAGGLAQKGIKDVEPFEIPKMSFDEPSGSIFLSATSSDRLAFESKKLGSSLFSHSIIMGLKGGADGNGDGIVTATELYEHSFRQSQLQSQIIPTAIQKPEFISDLRGRGAVALSFPSADSGHIHFLKGLEGTIQIRSLRGLHSFKLAANDSRSRKVELAAGEYQINVNANGNRGIAQASVFPNQMTVMTAYDFDWQKPAEPASLAQKGRPKQSRRASISGLLGITTIEGDDTTLESIPSIDVDIFRYDFRSFRLSVGGVYGQSNHEQILSTRIKSDWNLVRKRLFNRNFRLEMGIHIAYSELKTEDAYQGFSYFYYGTTSVNRTSGAAIGAQVAASFDIRPRTSLQLLAQAGGVNVLWSNEPRQITGLFCGLNYRI